MLIASNLFLFVELSASGAWLPEHLKEIFIRMKAIICIYVPLRHVLFICWLYCCKVLDIVVFLRQPLVPFLLLFCWFLLFSLASLLNYVIWLFKNISGFYLFNFVMVFLVGTIPRDLWSIKSLMKFWNLNGSQPFLANTVTSFLRF